MPKLVDVAVGASLDVRTMQGATFDLTARISPGSTEQDYTNANLKAAAKLGFFGEQLFNIEGQTNEGSVTGGDFGRIRLVFPWDVTAEWAPRTYRYVVSMEIDTDVWEPVLQGLLVVTPNPEL